MASKNFENFIILVDTNDGSVETTCGNFRSDTICDEYTNDMYIKSPNYPEVYENDERCDWTFRMKKGISINLTFFEFDVQGSANSDCYRHDSLTIFTSENGMETLVGKFCNGKNRPERTMLLKGDEIGLVFTTDRNSAYKGFKIGYTWVKPGR